MKLDTGINKNNSSTTMNISIYILLKIHKLQIHVYNFKKMSFDKRKPETLSIIYSLIT